MHMHMAYEESNRKEKRIGKECLGKEMREGIEKCICKCICHMYIQMGWHWHIVKGKGEGKEEEESKCICVTICIEGRVLVLAYA